MSKQPLGPLGTTFARLHDPRVERTKHHQLLDIVLIAICAVVCGAEDWVEVEAFGKTKKKWLKRFLALPNGIPLARHVWARVCGAGCQRVSALFYGVGACGERADSGAGDRD